MRRHHSIICRLLLLRVICGLALLSILALNFRMLALELLHISTSTTTNASLLGLDRFQQRNQDTVLRPQKRTRRRNYLKFDEAAPRAIPGTARSHILPNAIPQRRTIPNLYAQDESYHIAKRTNCTTQSIVGVKGHRRPFYSDTPESGWFNSNHNYTTDNRALYLYNPAVLPLLQTDADSDTDTNTNTDASKDEFLSETDWKALTGGDSSVAYLATFRANTGGNCFGPDHPTVMKTGEQISYLAVALLDRDLNVVTGTDVLIDLNAGPSFGKYFQQFQEDCKPSLLRGAIYLLCNERMFRVQIVRAFPDGDESNKQVQNQAPPPDGVHFHTRDDVQYPYRYPNIYGNGLEITLFSQTKIAGGKNLNIFRAHPSSNRTSLSSSSSSSSPSPLDYYLQLYPLPHRFVRLVVPPHHDVTTRIRAEKEQLTQASPAAVLPQPSFDGPDTANTILTCPANERGDGTWTTNCTDDMEEKPFFADKDHGTACCLDMVLSFSLLGNDDNKDKPPKAVKVGISHTKTSLILNPWWRRDIRGKYNERIGGKRYLSRFVAYSAVYPFEIVARSGWFCLGFANEGEGNNTLAGRNRQYKLDLFGDTYECPMIHFASGIADYVGNSSRAVISYGVSDCHARMIVVEKKDIEKLLLGI